MSQSIGIHLGERRYHVVALEGSLKKHRLVCAASGEIPPGPEGAREVSEELRALAKRHKLKADSVYLAIDAGVAAFRMLTLPFDDRAKIEEVLKFEVESDLPQYDIEQVVVDFLVLSTKPGVESNLLVTAVPKERLSAALALCEKGGLEALDAELEGTALFDAAFESGVLVEEQGTVLIHVGDTSTTVAVADGRRLASLRAIRVGAGAAARPPVASGEARPEGEGEAEAAPDVAPALDDPARAAATAQRVRRELVRTLSGARTASAIQQVFVCGQVPPGLIGDTLLDVPVQALPLPLAEVENPAHQVVAYGAALRGFAGGTLRPSLRREELRFSGKFERLELPLAVFSLLLFTLLFVRFIVLEKQLEWRDEGNLAADPPLKGDLQIWLERNNERLFPDPKDPRPVRLTNPPEKLARLAAEAEAGRIADRTKFQEILDIRGEQKKEIDRLSRELGQVSEIKQPQSALTASTLVMNLVAGMGETARIGIRKFEARFQSGSANRNDHVVVTLDLDFFGANSLEATRNYNQLEKAFKDQPWCQEFDGKSSKVLDGDKGIQVDGLGILVNVDRALQLAEGGQP